MNGYLPRISPHGPAIRLLRAFVAGSVLITLMGVAIHLLLCVDRSLAADLLRYYWFRATDVALPLGVALEGVAILAWAWTERPTVGRSCLALVLLVAAFHLGDLAIDRIALPPPTSHRAAEFHSWRAACQWVADPKNIPVGARFITPRLAQTFKWYTGHSNVVDWKDIPQNAAGIIQWWQRIRDLYATGAEPPEPRWFDSPANVGVERLRQLAAKYEADYAIASASDPPLDLPIVYSNPAYVIYRLQSIPSHRDP